LPTGPQMRRWRGWIQHRDGGGQAKHSSSNDVGYPWWRRWVPRAPARPSRPQSSSRWSSTARPTCGRWTSRPTPARRLRPGPRRVLQDKLFSHFNIREYHPPLPRQLLVTAAALCSVWLSIPADEGALPGRRAGEFADDERKRGSRWTQ
jgi:hypothetical protein